MKIPKAIEKVIEGFERLPGIGPKSAQRLAFYLLHVPQYQLDEFAESLTGLKKNTVMCSTCFNIGDTELCSICSDFNRDKNTICIVEDALDVIAIERGGKFKGVFHVLHGVIDPLNSMGPDDIYIPQLIARIKNFQFEKPSTNVSGIIEGLELILATNPTMEGEATAMYIMRDVQKVNTTIKITRIGRGLPVGADLEYADEITLQRAMEGRREY